MRPDDLSWFREAFSGPARVRRADRPRRDGDDARPTSAPRSRPHPLTSMTTRAAGSPRPPGDSPLIRSQPRSRRASKSRKVTPLVDRLEDRQVLSASPAALQVAHPMFAVSPYTGNGPGGG